MKQIEDREEIEKREDRKNVYEKESEIVKTKESVQRNGGEKRMETEWRSGNMDRKIGDRG